MNAVIRYNNVRGDLNRKDIDNSLKMVRRVRNGLAHCVEQITPDGVTGNYEVPISYSAKYLRQVLKTADLCSKDITKSFLKKQQYVKWKEIGKSETKVA